MGLILEAREVGIRFVLHHERATTLKERVIGVLRSSGDREEFWAVRRANFCLQAGESLGIVGANGSGKSTLLKMMAGIYEPDEGQIKVAGRISALLELGAGFHPELTGRQNLYLYGAIHGLSRHEMHERIPRIVQFAELQRFIDIPVKNYSSGMYTRLGFAAAIDVQPDLLLVDEILAVGDVSFQSKCFQRIEELQHRGTSLVLVSHDLNSVERFCQKVMVLHEGKQIFFGSAGQGIEKYLALYSPAAEDESPLPVLREGPQIHPSSRRSGLGGVQLEQVRAKEVEFRSLDGVHPGVELRIAFRSNGNVFQPDFSVRFHKADGKPLAHFSSVQLGYQISRLPRKGWIGLSLFDFPLPAEPVYLSVECVEPAQQRVQCSHALWYELPGCGTAGPSLEGATPRAMFRLSMDPFWRCEPCRFHYAQMGREQDWATESGGWHCVEFVNTGFRWTMKQAEFGLHNPERKKHLSMTVGAGYLLERKGQAVGQLFQDNQPIGRLVLPSYEPREVLFSLASAHAEYSTIRIEMEKGFLPLEESKESLDPRELGITLINVRLQD